MNKEFDSFREKYWDEWPDSQNDRELKSVLADFFTAGRALGRREMKGEAKEACKAAVIAPHLKIIGQTFTDAIEAIPEC